MKNFGIILTEEVKTDNDTVVLLFPHTASNAILVQVRRKLIYNFSSKNSFENFSASLGYAKFLSTEVSLEILAKSL